MLIDVSPVHHALRPLSEEGLSLSKHLPEIFLAASSNQHRAARHFDDLVESSGLVVGSALMMSAPSSRATRASVTILVASPSTA